MITFGRLAGGTAAAGPYEPTTTSSRMPRRPWVPAPNPTTRCTTSSAMAAAPVASRAAASQRCAVTGACLAGGSDGVVRRGTGMVVRRGKRKADIEMRAASRLSKKMDDRGERSPMKMFGSRCEVAPTSGMPLQGEVLAGRPEALEESLSTLQVAKSPHASLAFAGRLMAVLGAVVHAGSGLHEHVLDVGERRDVSLGSRVAA